MSDDERKHPTGRLLDTLENVDKLLDIEAQRIRLIHELRRTVAYELAKRGARPRFAEKRGDRCPLCNYVVVTHPDKHECPKTMTLDLRRPLR